MKKTIKQKMQALLYNLPDDCTFDDIQYHFYVLEKVRKGVDAIEQGRITTRAAVINYFNQKIQIWTTN